MSQIFLFTGENEYTICSERMRWTKQFREKHGEENLHFLEAKGLSCSDVINEVAAAPFIAENRLVVVEGQMKWNKADTEDLLARIHPQVVLLFILVLDPSKRGKVPATMKELTSKAEVKRFPLLSRTQLLIWVDSFTKELESSIAPDARDTLLEMVGEHQCMLAQELQKLSLYAGDTPISKQHVEEMAMCAGDRQVWFLMDLLGAGKAEDAVIYVQSLLARGGSVHGIWAQFLWMVSQLVLVWTAMQEGVTHPVAMVKHVGVSPSAARALSPCARRLDRKAIERITKLVTRTDREIKTGELRATVGASEELCAALDGCLLAFEA